MKKIISVVGARPNFMKVAPLHKAFKKYENEIKHLVCHTGQHYDEKMSQVFFKELELPEPDFYLGVGSGSHAEQTGRIMIEFEKVLLKEKPDLVIVVGDVNSTIACSLTARKLHINVAHVEAGLRSFDREMPEEINRLLTDSIADFLFVTEKSGMENLKNEGVDEKKIFFTGNVMIDSLVNYLPKAEKSDILDRLNLNTKEFVLVTMHRPSNVDSGDRLAEMVNFLNKVGEKRKVIFPVHPRTRNNLNEKGATAVFNKNIILTDPIGYIDFLKLIKSTELILTDSGGIQEESTYLGVPCITIRTTTERPVTVDVGTNILVGDNFEKAYEETEKVLGGQLKSGETPELWDGKAAERIAEVILKIKD